MKEIKDLKLMSFAEVRKLSYEKLILEMKGAEKKLYVLKMKLRVGELKQIHLVKALRRYIAGLKTQSHMAK